MNRRYTRDTEQARRNEMLPVEIGGDAYQFRWERKCRVCNNGAEFVAVVNNLLLSGYTYTATYEQAVRLDTRKNKISFQSVYKHGKNHMPSTSDVVRKSIEKRSQRLGQDFVSGSENLINEVTYAETLMTKAFQLLVENKIDITAKDGLEAARTLRQFTKDDDETNSLTGILSQLNDIITAVRETVPPDMYQDIVARLEGPKKEITASERFEEEDEDVFDPGEAPDEDERDLV